VQEVVNDRWLVQSTAALWESWHGAATVAGFPTESWLTQAGQLLERIPHQPESIRQQATSEGTAAVTADPTSREPQLDRLQCADSPADPTHCLSPSRQKAYQLYYWATQQNPDLRTATDKEVYDWLKEHPDVDDASLPCFDTFQRYLRAARQFFGSQKNTPRAGRSDSRSVVRRDEI
jgi:hypothetical protein